MILSSTQVRLNNCTTWTIAVVGIFTLCLLYFKQSLPSAPWHEYTNLSLSICPRQKPNLILSSMDGAKWQDQIYKFMESLEVALGRDLLQHQRARNCLPAPVYVKIIVPPDVSGDLSPSFKALKLRFPHLDFPGYLPEPEKPGVLTRFIGWSNLVQEIGSSYNKVLVMVCRDLRYISSRDAFECRGLEHSG